MFLSTTIISEAFSVYTSVVNNACCVGLPGEQAEISECFLKTAMEWWAQACSKDRCAPLFLMCFKTPKKHSAPYQPCRLL